MISTNTHRHSLVDKKIKVTGFTLTEVLIGIAVLGILAALAAPNFVQALNRYKSRAIQEEFSGSLQLAKVEAIRRRTPVILVRTTACGLTQNIHDWSCGWEVFVDTNDNNQKNVNEPTLQVSTIPSDFKMLHPGLGQTIGINAWGNIQGVGQRIVIGPRTGAGDNTSSTAVCINSGGRIRVATGTDICSP
jgi:type IV fimbrial biogenesis protein FimT